MLFNSHTFLFAFFPCTVVIFFILGYYNHLVAQFWLSGASLFFYGWWNASFVWLLLASVLFNYCAGYLISHTFQYKGYYSRFFLIVAVSVNLLLLVYFKYAGFIAETVDEVFGWTPRVRHILLPLGISFFTFTQIAFLVDAYQRKAKEFSLIHYILFVTYFPHLIAGPILHHRHIMPQFADFRTYRVDWSNISVGWTVFVISLAKKVFIADTFGTIATPIFLDAQHGVEHVLTVAWAGALAYTFQLYFDFSGYSDMAIGLSLFFNVKLPLNFNSPYKATNIIDFWKRWHMTLSAFLLYYLYIPLGGNRYGSARRYLNLLVTMLLGGLWHGAGWTFIIWGSLHGLYLVVNHGFRAVVSQWGWQNRLGSAGKPMGVAITFLSVVVAWVFFRAESLTAASTMLHGMIGTNGLFDISDFGKVAELSFGWWSIVALIGIGLVVGWLLPNTQEFMRFYHPAYESAMQPSGLAAQLVWQPTRWWTWSSVGVLFALVTFALSTEHGAQFLYYQF